MAWDGKFVSLGFRAVSRKADDRHMPELNPSEWGDVTSCHPDTHILQTREWGILKDAFGWQSVRLASEGVGAQILFRRLPLGFSVAYIPKGPLYLQDEPHRETASFWNDVDQLCKSKRTVFLKVEPDACEETVSEKGSKKILIPPGFRRSSQTIQPPRTLLIDLTGEEEQVLARMKQKTRYNIRLALKKGIVVRSSADLEAFYRLVQVTGGRDSFGVHTLAYYRKAYELFHPRGGCELLMAEFKGEPLAGLLAFANGKRAWYFYGASSNEHRERMPTYLLQWEAMRWARSLGCTLYDMWGVPDEDEETLEANFATHSDGLWGVYRFKRGFGGRLTRAAGPWDRVYNSFLYGFYRWWTGMRSVAGEG
jgi:peptidoglycan pentaglycine glycine transferase (the first glycine)